MTEHCIVLDWLEFICTGELVQFGNPLETYEYDQGRIVLEQLPHGSKHFRYGYKVYQDGQHFATVFLSSRSPEIIDPSFIQVKIENNILYELSPVARCQYVFSRLGWAVRNVTRVDIALDGADALSLVDRWLHGVVEKAGRASVNPHYTGKRELTGADFGKKCSSKWMTVYNKSLELTKSNKNYIRDWWVSCGLSNTENVERVELKLRNEAVKKIEDFDWTLLDDFEYLASILRTHTKNFFEFYIPDDINSTRCTRVPWCDWNSIGALMLPVASTKQSAEVYRMKVASKLMYQVFVKTGIQYYANIAQELASNCNCLDWYIERLDRWRDQLSYSLSKGGSQYVLNFEQYDENKQLKLFDVPEAVDYVEQFSSL